LKSEYSPLVSKAYSRFKRGVEIRWRDIQQNMRMRGKLISLTDLLIKIPQTKTAIRGVNQILFEIENSNEMNILVVNGEYGQGKSQIAQIIEEHFSNKELHPNVIPCHLDLSTIPKFIKEFSRNLRNYFQRDSAMSKIGYYLDLLSKEINEDPYPLMSIIQNFIEVLIETTNHGRIVALIFDEFDIILRNPHEFKPWGDLFVRLNDTVDLKLLLILLLPQNTANQIRAFDKRLHRWDTAFGIESIMLTGKYLDKVPIAVANILTMKSIISRIQFNEFYLSFVSKTLDFQFDHLRNYTIRSVNTWTVELAEMLHKLMSWNLERLVNIYNRLDRTDRGDLIEECLRNFFLNTQLPDFKLKNHETDELDIYRVFYSNKNIKSADKISDGHFNISRLMDKIVVDEEKIAVEIKYSSNGMHTTDQIKKIRTLAQGFPTIFISLGTSKEYINSLNDKITLWKRESVEIYPLIVVRIPDELLYPLLTIQNKDDPEFNNIVKVLTVWAKRFCPFLPILENYFKSLSDNLLERRLAVRIKSIKGIESVSTSGSSGTIHIGSTHSLNDGIRLLCSYIDVGIKQYKQVSVLEKDVIKRIERKYPSILVDFQDNFRQALNELNRGNMIQQFQRGTKDNIKKTLNWNVEDAVKSLIKNLS